MDLINGEKKIVTHPLSCYLRQHKNAANHVNYMFPLHFTHFHDLCFWATCSCGNQYEGIPGSLRLNITTLQNQMKMSVVKSELRHRDGILKLFFFFFSWWYQLEEGKFNPNTNIICQSCLQEEKRVTVWKIIPLSSKPCVISWPITMPMPPKLRDLAWPLLKKGGWRIPAGNTDTREKQDSKASSLQNEGC